MCVQIRVVPVDLGEVSMVMEHYGQCCQGGMKRWPTPVVFLVLLELVIRSVLGQIGIRMSLHNEALTMLYLNCWVHFSLSPLLGVCDTET